MSKKTFSPSELVVRRCPYIGGDVPYIWYVNLQDKQISPFFQYCRLAIKWAEERFFIQCWTDGERTMVAIPQTLNPPHVFVIIRVDDRSPACPLEEKIIAHSVYHDEKTAQEEVSRLNALNGHKGSVYFAQISRLR